MVRKKVRKNPVHSKFYTTVASHRFRAEEGEGTEEAPGFQGPEEEEVGHGGYRRAGQQRRSEREDYSINLTDAQRLAQQNPHSAARELAYWKTRTQRNVRPTIQSDYNINMAEATELAHSQPHAAAREIAHWKTQGQRNVPPTVRGPAIAELDKEFQRPRVSKQDVNLIRRGERQQSWRTERGVYRTPTAKDRKAPGSFISEELPSSHRQWLDEQLQNRESEFNKGLDLGREKTGRLTPAQRRRLAIYTDALQRGESHQEAHDQVRRSRLREGVGRPPTERIRESRMVLAREALAPPPPSGRETKFKSLTPLATEFTYGISASRRPSLEELKKKWPGRPEQELVQVQQAGTEVLSQELLANQKWAHETRRANLLGTRSGKPKETSDRVTIFTTNAGHPAVSVPTESLVGQYIIRRRKSILGGYGVPATQLRGKFPDAVRDAHIIDIASGSGWSVQGRQGLVTSTGYRFGNKQSQGYGRPRPVGAHVLYDPRSGRPLYDAQGNIRYSEGATRPIDWASPMVGARILIG